MKIIRLIFESFRFALGALKGNLLRTTLSLLGVTIGIFSIIAVFTIVDSLEKGIRSSFSFVGENVLYVQKWPWGFSGDYPWWKYWQRPEAGMADFKFLEKNLTLHNGIAIFSDHDNVVVKYKNNSINNGYVEGVTFGYNKIADVPIETGRYFSMHEINSAQPVVIIGNDIVKILYQGIDPIGKDIKIKGLKYTVIGVMERQGASFLEGMPSNDNKCIVPFGMFQKMFYTGKGGVPSAIAVKGRPDDPGLLELENEVIGQMRSVRGLSPKQDDNFAINRPEMLANAITSMFAVMTVAGWIIGSFSILVGGFGIANIMFVSVKERTNLIGIQKSLGAKNYFILLQFLFEAIFLSVIGGGVGIFLVYLITFLPFGDLEVTMSINNIMLGLFVSVIIGTLSGIIPAALAAKLDPVVAIRSK